MRHIFICHASEDKKFARRLLKDLEHHGIRVWLDERDLKVGEPLRETIDEAIENSYYVLVLLSLHSVSKEWTKKELSAAFALEVERGQRVIIPVVLGNVIVPLLIRDKLYVDISRQYSKGLQKIIRSIQEPLAGRDERLERLRSITTLEFIRLDGSLARFTRTHTLRCIEGEVGGHIEEFTSDGYVDSFKISPGKIERSWIKTGVTYVDTTFDRILKRGDTITQTFSCMYRDSYCESSEYYEAKQFSVTRGIRIDFVFLKGRSPINFVAYELRGSDHIPLGKQPIPTKTASGRICYSIVVSKPILMHSYGAKWDW